MKKIINITNNVIFYLVLIVCLTIVLLTIISDKNKDGSYDFLNYQMRLVTSDSMQKSEKTDVSNFKIKSIPKNSLVLVKMVNNNSEWYDELAIGDVLTFKYFYTEQVTITHRIIDIEEEEGEYIITLEGDNKSSEAFLMKQIINTADIDTHNYIIGKVVCKSLILGYVISLFKNPLSLCLIVIFPCSIVIIYELINIYRVYNSKILQTLKK